MKVQRRSPISDTLKDAIVESGIPYKTQERETGVQRSRIQRFVDGRPSIRLDMADRLADSGKIPAGYLLGASRRWDLAEIEEFPRGGCKPPKAKGGR